MSYQGYNNYNYEEKEETPWMMEENNLADNLDEYGFEDKNYEIGSLFDLKPIDIPKFNKSEKIRTFEVSEQSLIIITESNKVVRWRFKDYNCCEYDLSEIKDDNQSLLQVLNPGNLIYNAIKKFPLGESKKDVVYIDRVFMDPKGHHTLICCDKGENFYFNNLSEKLKYLSKLKGVVITSVAWNEESVEKSTNEILLGTKDGSITLYKCEWSQKGGNEIIEDSFKPLVVLPGNKFIENIELVILSDNQGNKILFIIVSSNSSLFYFKGPGAASSSLEILFEKYKDPDQIRKSETPYPKSKKSILHIFYTKPPDARAHSFIRTNGHSIAYYKFPEKNENITDFSFFNSPQSLKYAKKTDIDETRAYIVQEMPLGIALSEFHYFLLHEDSITILSKITEKVVKCEELNKNGFALGMRYEKSRDEIWIFTTKGILQMSIKNEDKDAWKLYMEKNKYKEAYEICKKYNSQYTNYVGGLYADQLLINQRAKDAADLYAINNRNFEEISLKFLIGKSVDGFEAYLENWLSKIKPEDKNQKLEEKGQKTDEKIQRKLLLTLLTELKLYKLNKIENAFQESQNPKNEDEIVKLAKKKRLEDARNDLNKFLTSNIQDLDESITYQLMQSHGKFNNCINFAKEKGNYEMIILHHINEEQYKEAISNLRFVKDETFNNLLYRYCHIFMKHEPALTNDLLQNHVKHEFDPTKLIAGLMDIPKDKREIGISFLKYCIEKLNCKKKTIYNILIFFLSEQENLEALYDFLKKQEQFLSDNETLYFDLDFALRIFKRKNIVIAQISIYGMMGLYSEAVTLALNNNAIDIAKSYANKPENDDLKKKLWLQIAIHLFNKGTNIEQVISLTKETSLIKIEDLLPYFNENIKIEHFKEEICNSLNEYNSQIESLKAEMEGYSNNAEQLKNDLRTLKNKYIVIESSQKCDECYRSIYLEEFYIFPCLHGFHKECLLKRISESPIECQKLPEIEELNKKMQLLLLKATTNVSQKNKNERPSATSFFFGFLAGKTSMDKNVPTLNAEEERILKELKERYDFLLASGCLNCSSSVVDSIYVSFDLDEKQRQSWDLKLK